MGFEQVKLHKVPYNSMGVMVYLSGYCSGDLVEYGGMPYRPVGPGPCSGFLLTCGEHRAEIWDSKGRWLFYCS